MEFLEHHARVLYRLLNHGVDFSDCRCIDVNRPGSAPLSREVLKGEEQFIEWCRAWNGKANCYVGRNPRNADGTVSKITTYSLDVDPEHPPRTSVSPQQLGRAVMAGRDILCTWPGGYLAESGNGALVLYRLSDPVSGDLETFKRWLADWQDEVRKLLAVRFPGEIRCDSIHDNERIIKIPGTMSVKGDPANWRLARWPTVPASPFKTIGWQSPPPSSQAPRLVKRFGGPLTIERIDQKLQLATASLARLKKERCDEYDAWIKVGLALSELGPIGLQLWETWSKRSEKYQPGTCEAKWATFTKDPLITVGSLAYWASQDSPNAGQGSDSQAGKTESLDEFLLESKPTNWICDGIVARGEIGFIAGLPETMKTWLAIDLALEASRPEGGLWLGLFPVVPSKVLYIDQERPRGETQRRFNGVLGAKGLSLGDVRGRFFMRCGTTTRLDFQPSFQAFRRELMHVQPDIVLVDSFATFHTGNENSLQDMQRVMESVKALRNEFGCAIIFIDHENKGTFHAEREGEEDPSAFRMKGSVAKPAAAELVLTVRRFDHSSSTVYNTKNTFGPKIASFTVSVHDTPQGHILVEGSK